jgi:hypothetical protein
MGIGVAVTHHHMRPVVITPTGAQEQQDNRKSDYGPTYRLASSPEAARGPLSVP